MLIRDVPENLENYYMADGKLAFTLHQAGAKPLYMDGDVVYFKKNNKLFKILRKLGVEF